MRDRTYRLEISESLQRSLEELATEQNVPFSEVLRRALALQGYLARETRSGKKRVMLTDQNGAQREILVTK